MSFTDFSFSDFVQMTITLGFEARKNPKDRLKYFCYSIEAMYATMTKEERAIVRNRLIKAFAAIGTSIYEDPDDWADHMKEKGYVDEF
jgi:hypothetical protein